MTRSVRALLTPLQALVPVLLLLTAPAFGAEEPVAPEAVQINVNIVWTCLAAFMVFFMQAGFAMVEAGFTRAKNAVNILMKNLMDFSIGTIAFFFVGFGLMFGAAAGKGTVGVSLFALSGADPAAADWTFTFLLFQTVFAGTAATIVSGAVAGRTKYTAYLAYSVFICALIYPVFGKWAWGSLLLGSGGAGWLEGKGFVDFAGSTVVHSVGGWLALAGAIAIGPRLGKYGPDGRARAILGHNLTLGGLGVFILWFGWFGFNAGSTTTGTAEIGRIALVTNLSAAAGAVTAMFAAWFLTKKPDVSMALNGALAGLVGITAGCASVSPLAALAIGAIAGPLCVVSVLFIDRRLRIDDPVGAVSVHGVCGAWGTLAVGLFQTDGGLLYGGGAGLLGTQLLGVGVAFAWAFGTGLVLFYGIRAIMGLRVTADEELRGLDHSEHGMEAYAGFQIFINE